MGTTTAKVEQVVKAKSCDLCWKVYAQEEKPGYGFGQRIIGEGIFTREDVRVGTMKMELCPSCAAVTWDQLQERKQPDPNPPPTPVPPPAPRRSFMEPFKTEAMRAAELAAMPRCGTIFVLESPGQGSRICARERSHVGLCDDNTAANLAQRIVRDEPQPGGDAHCDDCNWFQKAADLTDKGDHHGGRKRVCTDRDACHERTGS